MKGSLFFSNQILREDLIVTLEGPLSPEPLPGLGDFTIPGLCDFDPDGRYQIRLHDGRSFEIAVRELKLTGSGSNPFTTVTFETQEQLRCD